jgi:hypothetical protein
MDMRRESNERMADFAVADVSLFWLLNALNSAEPVLGQFLRTRKSRRSVCIRSWHGCGQPADLLTGASGECYSGLAA